MPKPHKTLRSFSTGIHEEEPPVDCSERSALAPSLTPKQAYRGCLLCKQSHSLEFCKQFQKMTLNECKTLLRNRGYCYGCMDGKHLSRTCNRRKECQTCGGLHPTLLHEDSWMKKRIGVPSTERLTKEEDAGAKCDTEPNLISHQIDTGETSGYYNQIVPSWFMCCWTTSRIQPS